MTFHRVVSWTTVKGLPYLSLVKRRDISYNFQEISQRNTELVDSKVQTTRPMHRKEKIHRTQMYRPKYKY